MLNLLDSIFSGDFFDNLSDTFEDIVDTTETVLDTVVDFTAEVVDNADEVADSVEQFVDQNEDALDTLSETELPNFTGVEFPEFPAPSSFLDLPNSIFSFLQGLTETDFSSVVFPTLPTLNLSGLDLGTDTVDLNLDLDLNEAVEDFQDVARQALDDSSDLPDQISDAAEDVIELVEGFIEEDPLDIAQAFNDVVDIVDSAVDGVQDAAEEDTVTGIIGGIFDIVSGIAQGVEDIIGFDTGVPEIVDNVGDITAGFAEEIGTGELETFSFLENVFELSDEVGDFLDSFNELVDDAIASFDGLDISVNGEIDRDLLISVGDVVVDVSNTVREISDGLLLTENPFDALNIDSDAPTILSASVTASGFPTSDGSDGTRVIASAAIVLEEGIFSADAAVNMV